MPDDVTLGHDYEPAELAQLLEDFDVEVTYNKHKRTLQLAATLALDTPPEKSTTASWAVAQL